MWKWGELGQLFRKNFTILFINHCTYSLICPSGYISVPIRPARTESGQVSRFASQREKFNSSVFCLRRTFKSYSQGRFGHFLAIFAHNFVCKSFQRPKTTSWYDTWSITSKVADSSQFTMEKEVKKGSILAIFSCPHLVPLCINSRLTS